MNLFGKILIMLNLLMSLVFMGFAVAVYSTHKNWKEVVTLDKATAQATGKKVGLQFQLDDSKAINAQLEEKLLALQKEIKQELAMRNARLQVLETEKENLTKQVETKTLEIEQVTADKKITSAAIESLTIESGKKSAEIQALSDEIDRFRGELQSLFDKLLVSTDQVAKTQSELDRANAQAKVLVGQLSNYKKALSKLGVDNPITVASLGSPPPKIDGIVRASTPDGLVEISLGADDGLMRGHTLEVYREGATPNATKYLGRIEILSTKADISVGKVLQQYRRGTIEKDDRVATRFN